ncbi:MAG: hypothetical protein ABI721_00765 [Candidatus Dojkabacteria bacterium]
MNESNLDSQLDIFYGRVSSHVLEKLNNLIRNSPEDVNLSRFLGLMENDTNARSYVINNVLNNNTISFGMKSDAELRQMLMNAYAELKIIGDTTPINLTDSTPSRLIEPQQDPVLSSISYKQQAELLKGVLETQEINLVGIINQGTTKYLVNQMVTSLEGNINPGKTSVEDHTIRNTLTKIFLSTTQLISLKKRLNKKEEYSDLINDVDNFINKYVAEMNSHFLEAGTSEELSSIFNHSPHKFTESFNRVLEEEASRTYREIGVKLPTLS